MTVLLTGERRFQQPLAALDVPPPLPHPAMATNAITTAKAARPRRFAPPNVIRFGEMELINRWSTL